LRVPDLPRRLRVRRTKPPSPEARIARVAGSGTSLSGSLKIWYVGVFSIRGGPGSISPPGALPVRGMYRFEGSVALSVMKDNAPCGRIGSERVFGKAAAPSESSRTEKPSTGSMKKIRTSLQLLGSSLGVNTEDSRRTPPPTPGISPGNVIAASEHVASWFGPSRKLVGLISGARHFARRRR
jgi:hypothetical protein